LHSIKQRKFQVQYLLKWKGYPHSCNSWEPAEHLNNCSLLIREYEEEQVGLKSGKKGTQLDTIVGSFKNGTEIIFIMKWKDLNECTLMSSKIANYAYTQAVIKFYEDRISWD